ncbi:MAG: hypothetical protein IAE90_07340 [Ignavibacteria bacterium]|nr:hypothetical protein [Ignavibacteria bacterium]
MFHKKQIKETVPKEVIAKYYSLAEIKELIKKDAEAQGYKATKIIGYPGGGAQVEAKEIPGFNMPKSVAETEGALQAEGKEAPIMILGDEAYKAEINKRDKAFLKNKKKAASRKGGKK